MNLLVGATGFVGGHLVEYLFQQGEISKGVFRKGSYLKIMDTNGVQGMEADLSDHHSLHEAMEGVDMVYSLASPMPDSDSDFEKPNTEGVLNLLEVAAEAKVKAFIHLSPLDVYGFMGRRIEKGSAFKPANEYQRSKVEAERLLSEFSKRNAAPRIAIVRSAKAIGSRDETLIVPILRMIEEGKVVLPGGTSMSYSHPKDIAQAMYRAALTDKESGHAYLVKSFDATPGDLVQSLLVAIGKDAEVKKEGFRSSSRIPRYAAEQLRASLTIEEQPEWKELGYSPKFNLKSTSEEIASWYRKEPWIIESA